MAGFPRLVSISLALAGKRTKVQKAAEWLADYIGHEGQAVSKCIEHGEQVGFSRSTICRAKDSLEIETYKDVVAKVK